MLSSLLVYWFIGEFPSMGESYGLLDYWFIGLLVYFCALVYARFFILLLVSRADGVLFICYLMDSQK